MIKAREKAKELVDAFIGLAHDGMTSSEENAQQIAIICARYIKANCEPKHELKVYWLDVIYELKSKGYERV